MPDNISKYNDSLTYAERSDHAREAGKASGRVRRARAKLVALSKRPAVLNHLEKQMNNDAIAAIADAVIRSALRGNISAVRFILSLEDDLYRDEPEQFIIIRHSNDEE